MTHTETSSLAFISLQTYFLNFQLNQKSRGVLPTPIEGVVMCQVCPIGTIKQWRVLLAAE